MEHNIEHCQNPWEDTCRQEQIKLYIQFKGVIIPICERCWSKIASQDAEW
ncbi:MAG: hypothetical protein LBH62_07250 [Nitrososphaerota archaeon]|jgi:hypothetical protein|nr:hypothetical protein [Candidatus Termiticorpusculum sp.]MCL2256647.1 hypothetical protein [Candidatus Termiticorpusculum sp.]MCL2293174.1 hypothetical protein [Candidatus Termiticorpusculum sp.]MDR0461206.1 hypothetical protein [Nitrososphaerota archaeon]